MRKIRKLIVHCSATPNNKNVTIGEIRRWHKERGWQDIGYHYVIYRDGSIMSGRSVEDVGAHCKSQNHDSIGVCLIGNDVFEQEQFDSLQQLYNMLSNIFADIEIYGHRDFTNKKTCPNFEVKEIIQEGLQKWA